MSAAVSGRNGKELHTRISPYRAIIFSIFGAHTLFSDFEMQQNRIFSVGNPETYLGFIGIFSPIDALNRLEIYLFLIKPGISFFFQKCKLFF